MAPQRWQARHRHGHERDGEDGSGGPRARGRHDLGVPDASQGQCGEHLTKRFITQCEDSRPCGIHHRDGWMQERRQHPRQPAGERSDDDTEAPTRRSLSPRGDRDRHGEHRDQDASARGDAGRPDEKQKPKPRPGPASAHVKRDGKRPRCYRVRQQEPPVTDHESFGDEGIPDDQRRGDDSRASGSTAQEAQHAQARDERDTQQDDLLEPLPRHYGLDQRHDGVLGHRPWQGSAESQGSRQQVLAGGEDQVIAQREAGQQCRTDDDHGQHGHPGDRQPSPPTAHGLHGRLSWHA